MALKLHYLLNTWVMMTESAKLWFLDLADAYLLIETKVTSNDNSRLVWYAVITPLPPITTFSRAWWCRVSWHAQSQGVAWHVADGCSRLQFAWLHLFFPRLSLHMNNTKPRTVRNTSGCQGRWSQARAVKSHPGPHISPVAGEEQLGHVRQEERQLSYHRVRADL